MDRTSRHKIKETADLNNTVDQIDLTDIYRKFHPAEAEYTFFLSAHETFSKTHHMLGHCNGLNVSLRKHALET